MGGRIIAVSLRFRVLVVVLAAGLIVIGADRLTKMHTDVLPETSPTTVEVQTEALGLSGPEVESLITVPMEVNLLDGVMGVTSVTSDSVPGLSSIDLHFRPGFDLLQARQLVQERLTQAFALPNVSKPPVMLQPVSSTSRVMSIGLTSTTLSPLELSVLARWTIVPRLLGLAGVASVSTFGQADRQLQVQVDPARLSSHNVTLAQVIETAGNSQLVSPLTYLQASTPGTGGFLEGPNQRITIRHLLPFGTPRDLAQVPLAGIRGPPVTLGSVANVVQDHQPLIGSALVHGQPGLVLVVQKLPAAGVLAVTREVDQALAALRPDLAGVQIDASLFRAATYVKSSERNLLTGTVIAAALALLALVALAMQVRLACIALVATALSLLAATCVLDLLGYTFNALLALGLLMALATVIDDAVGAAQSVTRPSRTYAALRGASAYASLAVVLVVAPFLVATGPSARFVRPAVLALGLAVLSSMIVALIVTPALASVIPSGPPHSRARSALADRCARLYQLMLARTLSAPRAALVAVCLIGLAGIAVVPWLHRPRRPGFKDRSLVVHWAGAPGMSLQELGRITARASSELRALPEVKDVGANLGRALNADQVVNTNSGEIWVTIKPSADYDRALADVRSVALTTPGMRASVETYESDSMSGALSPSADTVTARVYGQDYSQLLAVAGHVRAAMSHVRGVDNPQLQLGDQQPSLSVEVNIARAEQHGVKPGDLRREASTLLSGLTVGNFFENQKVFDVVVVGTPAVRASLSSVRNLVLDTVSGGHVRLGDLASISLAAGPADIQHEAISRYVDVIAHVTGRSIASARTAVSGTLKTINFPLEYRAEVQSGSVDPGTSHAAFLGYVLAAMVGVLLLIQAALGSWSWALVVFLLLPVSLAGGVLAASATGTAGTLAADAGLIAATAIGIRQSLSMTGLIRRLQAADGGELTAAVVSRGAAEAAGPMISAAVVLATALVPFVVLGDVAGNELLQVAAAVLLGSLLSATLLNLFVLPALCLCLGRTRPAEPAEAIEDLDWAPPVEVRA